MLFHRGLEECVFGRYEKFDVNEFIVLSGYVGPEPIERLRELPLRSKIIYGMYGEASISKRLHERILSLNEKQADTTILYSKVPIHSKCYLWLKNGDLVTALVGSANFSVNGLRTDDREVLAETTRDSFEELQSYIRHIEENSIDCTSPEVEFKRRGQILIPNTVGVIDPTVAEMSFISERSGDIPTKSGINWGCSDGHVTKGDAYIPISRKAIMNHP